MDPQPEVIREQIETTRESLVNKLETLENQVKETVGTVTSTVENTVENVRSKVEGAVEAVSSTVKTTVEGVKKTFDIPYHTRRHPHAMAGGAFALGTLLGWMTMRRSWYTPEPYWPEGPEAEPVRREAHARRSWFANVLTPLTEEVDKIKATGLGVVFGVVRDALQQAAPESIAPRVGEIIDDMTRRAGATVLPSPVFGGKEHDGRGS
jgi:hypothetical protein